MKKLWNRLKLCSDYLRGATAVRGYPVSLEIEVTNKCNFNCITCPRHKMSRPQGMMGLGLFKQIVDESARQTESALLFHMGEPLLHPELPEMIGYVRSKSIRAVLFTNASLLSAERSEDLLRSGLDLLTISIDGAEASTFEGIRRGGRFEQVVSNIRGFMELKRRRRGRVTCHLHCVLSQRSRKEVEAVLRLGRELGFDSVRIKPFINTANLGPEIGEAPVPRGPSSPPCVMLWREPAIGWDGSMFPCCVDLIGDAYLGNVAREGIRSLWNGQAMQALRRAHVSRAVGSVSPCRSCNVFDVRPPVVAATTLFDDLTLRRVAPFFERLGTRGRLRSFRYTTTPSTGDRSLGA